MNNSEDFKCFVFAVGTILLGCLPFIINWIFLKLNFTINKTNWIVNDNIHWNRTATIYAVFPVAFKGFGVFWRKTIKIEQRIDTHYDNYGCVFENKITTL